MDAPPASTCACTANADGARIEDTQSSADVAELQRSGHEAATAAAAAAAGLQASTVRGWMTKLRAAAAASSTVTPTAAASAASPLASMEAPLASLLAFSFGITAAADIEPAPAAAPAAAAVAPSQLVQLRSNNRWLAREGALSLYSALMHVVVAAHTAQIAALYPVPVLAPASTAATPAPSPSAPAVAAVVRNPRDLFSKSSDYWRTDRLLRQTLSLLLNLVVANRGSALFLAAIVCDSLLLNVLFELLSTPPRFAAEKDVLDAAASLIPTAAGATGKQGAAEEDDDEFIVEYNSASPTVGSAGTSASGTSPPRKSSKLESIPQKAVARSSFDGSADDAAAASVDPSASFVANSFFHAQSQSDYRSGISIDQISPVSFLPLAKILALLKCILESVQAAVGKNSAPAGGFPSGASASGAAAGPPASPAPAAAAEGLKKPAALKPSGLSTPSKLGATTSAATPAKKPASAAAAASPAPKSGSKIGAAGAAAAAPAAAVGPAGAAGVFCTNCYRIHCVGGADESKRCVNSCNHLCRVVSASSSGALARLASQQLYPFQLQEICSILSAVHGSILYAPQLVGAVCNPAPQLADEDGIHNSTHGPVASDHASTLLRYAAQPVTRDFPFVVTNPMFPAAVAKQLSALVACVIPPPARAFEPQRRYERSGPEEDVLPEAVYAALAPALAKHMQSLARIMLVLLPGFEGKNVLAAAAAAPVVDLGASGPLSLGGSSSAIVSPCWFVDLRQSLLGPQSLSDPRAGEVDSYAFFLRRSKESLLSSLASILVSLRTICAAIPSAPGACGAPGSMLELRYFQSVFSAAGLPLLAAKLLGQDMDKTLALTTEGSKALPAAWAVVQKSRENWTKPATAAAAPSVVAGLSTRLLTSFVAFTSLIHFAVDAPVCAGSLLTGLVLYRSGVRRLLSTLCSTVLLRPESKNPLAGLALALKGEGVAAAHREVLEGWRCAAALAFRAFDPYMTAESIAAESAAGQPLAALRAFVTKQPSSLFHDGLGTLLYRWPKSPLSDLPALAAQPLSAHEGSPVTLTVRAEIGAASRRRFPYGDNISLPPVKGPSTGMTMTPSPSPGGHGGMGGGLAPEPPAEGSGAGILFQPVPVFASALCDEFQLARLGAAVSDRSAENVEALIALTKSFPADLERERLADDRAGKIDRLSALSLRAGVYASHPELQAYDLLPPQSDPAWPALSPSNLPPSSLTLYHFLLCSAAASLWATENLHCAAYTIELPLVAPLLNHKPGAKAMAARAAARKVREQRSKAARFLACAVSNWDAKPKQPQTQSADFFAHPFLSPAAAAAPGLTPALLDTLLSPTLAAPPPTAGSGAHSVAAAARRAADAGSIARGRIAMEDRDLQLGYAQLIASANFD